MCPYNTWQVCNTDILYMCIKESNAPKIVVVVVVVVLFQQIYSILHLSNFQPMHILKMVNKEYSSLRVATMPRCQRYLKTIIIIITSLSFHCIPLIFCRYVTGIMKMCMKTFNAEKMI